MTKSKRVLVISDFHCGHQVGLTHPDFNPRYTPDTPGYKLSALRTLYWRLFSEKVKELQPIDILFVNADCIEGKGERSGGTELLTSDRNEQVDMAVAVVETVAAKSTFMTYGTGYHTGKGEDWEDQIAVRTGAGINSQQWIDVNGLIFHLKHHISGSQVPHGRFTALARDRLWSVLWAEYGEYPKAHVLIRSHVHYHGFCGGPDWLALTTPGLQGYGTKFGARIMSGTVDFGFVWFDIQDKESWSWGKQVWKRREFGKQAIKA